MIPVRLSFKNFMCYRDNVPPLSFDGIHVACLCGDNGHGKSAIFDAMTWALWGESRAKSDDDLIHQGQSEVEAELDFDVADQRYRVLRKHVKRPGGSGTGHTMLEFQIAGDEGFRSISGNSKLQTQQKIVELLRIDYETFKNSAFLRQGHADEFSIKRPGERKEILANILDLSRYDELQRMAKGLAGEKEAQGTQLQSSVDDLGRQLAHRAEYENAVEEIQYEISRLEEKKRAEEATICALRQQKESLELKKEQLSNVEVHVKETNQELERWRARREQHQARVAGYERVLAEGTAIEKGHSDLVETKSRGDELNQRLSQVLAVRERIGSLDKVVRQTAEVLNIEHERIGAKTSDLEAKCARTSQLEEALVQARNHMTKLAELEETVAEKRRQAQQIVSRISHLESMNARFETEIADSRQKLRLLDQGDVRCPLCETELGVDGQQRIQQKLAGESEEKVKSHRANDEELISRRLELGALEDELAERQSVLDRERATWQSQLSITEKELAEARQASKELAQEKARLTEVEQRLSRKDYAVNEQETLLQLEREELELGYDTERHEHLRQQLVELQKYDALKQQLDEASRGIHNERDALNESEGIVSDLKKTVEADLERQEDLRSETVLLPDVLERFATAEKAYRSLLEDERRVRDSLAALQERLRHLAELEASRREKEELLRRLLKEEIIYEELAEAFGKKGIQALLIEQALPEIEMEASRLLAKMTDNRMSLTLESQRGKKSKKGDTIETLDIKIADELGTRNYEMYSGGEAFCIDLALRIALSKLLVRRAGASLPILIIDEGFGTQDNSGRERLVEAISSIQDDFDKVVVITHLEELKDRFPTLINVTKTADGSMISIG